MPEAGAAPDFEFVARARIAVDRPRIVGRTGEAQRRVVPILEGRFDGPLLAARVLPGGADWQTDHADGVLDIEARCLIETDDGVTISVVNRGLRSAEPAVMARLAAGERVAPHEYYFRSAPVFDAPPGPYFWMRRSVFVAFGEREPDAVILRLFRWR
jgi:hypothetical protein